MLVPYFLQITDNTDTRTSYPYTSHPYTSHHHTSQPHTSHLHTSYTTPPPSHPYTSHPTPVHFTPSTPPTRPTPHTPHSYTSHLYSTHTTPLHMTPLHPTPLHLYTHTPTPHTPTPHIPTPHTPVVDPLLPDYWGESASVVWWGFAASFSRQSSSRAATPEGNSSCASQPAGPLGRPAQKTVETGPHCGGQEEWVQFVLRWSSNSPYTSHPTSLHPTPLDSTPLHLTPHIPTLHTPTLHTPHYTLLKTKIYVYLMFILLVCLDTQVYQFAEWSQQFFSYLPFRAATAVGQICNSELKDVRQPWSIMDCGQVSSLACTWWLC